MNLFRFVKKKNRLELRADECFIVEGEISNRFHIENSIIDQFQPDRRIGNENRCRLDQISIEKNL